MVAVALQSTVPITDAPEDKRTLQVNATLEDDTTDDCDLIAARLWDSDDNGEEVTVCTRRRHSRRVTATICTAS
ncbi:hypothetical protein J6590_052870 [Homalodisca vitripennis]|nr:hypothetical protein J6590_052870 [Homalodisca vitripennis]